MSEYALLTEQLRAVNKGIFALVNQAAQEFGLSVAAKMIMGQLCECPGSTVSQLSRELGLAKSHVSTTVEQLVVDGLVEKCSDQSDHRLVRLFLTPRASAQFSAIDRHVEEHLQAALSGVPADQIQAMLAGLYALRNALSERANNTL
jgi:DNA-binding MarR family transcriptional regulator